MSGPEARLAALVLADPDGRPVPLAELSGQLTVVQLVRYFGCLPCQDWLIGLDAAAPTLSAHGARPIATGGSADCQARWLRDHRGVTMTMLIDSDAKIPRSPWSQACRHRRRRALEDHLRSPRRARQGLWVADQQVRAALDVADLGRRIADPRGLAAYATSLTHGFRPQRITRDTLRAPAVAILDDTLKVRWRFIGTRIGDYPPIGTILDAADSNTGRNTHGL